MIKKIVTKQKIVSKPSQKKDAHTALQSQEENPALSKQTSTHQRQKNDHDALEHMVEKIPGLIVAAITRCSDLAYTPTPQDPAESQRLTRATFLALKHLQELVNLAKKTEISAQKNHDTHIDELIIIAQQAVSLMSEQSANNQAAQTKPTKQTKQSNQPKDKKNHHAP